MSLTKQPGTKMHACYRMYKRINEVMSELEECKDQLKLDDIPYYKSLKEKLMICNSVAMRWADKDRLTHERRTYYWVDKIK